MALPVVACLAVAAGCARVEGPGAAGAGPAADGATVLAPDAAGDGGADRAAPPDAPPPAPDAAATGCVNLQCRVPTCPGQTTTTLSGTVYAPNGTLPLYNVLVYIPNAPVEPFKAGVSCDRCGVLASGHPLAVALSDAAGKFTIKNVPAGKDIPLVVQVGKWRRQTVVPNVAACQDNALLDANLTRLPRNRQEGDLPKIAVATGECDQLGCLFAKIGVSASEFGVAGDDRSIIYYRDEYENDLTIAGPPKMRTTTELWNDPSVLAQYDLTLLSCECGENLRTKSAASSLAMARYLAQGGRIFGSHYSYVWFRDSPDPPFAGAVAVMSSAAATATVDPMTINTGFPKGKALADWMKVIDPTVTYGQMTSRQIFNNLSGVTPAAAQVWATSPTSNMLPDHPRIVTVNTPVGVPSDQQCGRAALMDAHITPAPGYFPPGDGVTNRIFPGVCGDQLTKGEEALAFLLFDLSACIQDDSKPTVPPIIP